MRSVTLLWTRRRCLSRSVLAKAASGNPMMTTFNNSISYGASTGEDRYRSTKLAAIESQPQFEPAYTYVDRWCTEPSEPRPIDSAFNAQYASLRTGGTAENRESPACSPGFPPQPPSLRSPPWLLQLTSPPLTSCPTIQVALFANVQPTGECIRSGGRRAESVAWERTSYGVVGSCVRTYEEH